MPDFFESLQRAMANPLTTEPAAKPVIVEVRPNVSMDIAMDVWRQEVADGIHADHIVRQAEYNGILFVPADVWQHTDTEASPLRLRLDG